MDREVMHLRDALIPKYAELVYNGFWFSPERQALQAFVDESAEERHRHRAGEALQGQLHRRRPQVAELLYNPDIATMETDRRYNQDDATGFIRLNALRLRIAAYYAAVKDLYNAGRCLPYTPAELPAVPSLSCLPSCCSRPQEQCADRGGRTGGPACRGRRGRPQCQPARRPQHKVRRRRLGAGRHDGPHCRHEQGRRLVSPEQRPLDCRLPG